MLLLRSRGCHGRLYSIGIFIFSVVFLLSMSGVFHLLEPGGEPRSVLRRLDHAAIFTLIAGTFTPDTCIALFWLAAMECADSYLGVCHCRYNCKNTLLQ